MIAPLILAASALVGADRFPVVLTTDCGTEVDDQWALTHLAVSPRVELRAVVTTHAPGLPSTASTASAKGVLDRLKLPSPPPVVAGSTRPLASKTTPIPGPGVDQILKSTRDGTPDHRIKLFAIGAVTDVASALLTDPTLADRVEVIAMAFDTWPEGRDPWNVKNDVKAWQVLLASPVPLVVGDGFVCKKHLLMNPTEAHRLLDDCGPGGKALADDLDAWTAKNAVSVERESGKPRTWPIWDEVTVAYLLGLAEAVEHPRPRLRDDLTFDHGQPKGTLRWVRSIRTEPFWKDLAEGLKAR